MSSYPFLAKFNSDILNMLVEVLNLLITLGWTFLQPIIMLAQIMFGIVFWMIDGCLFVFNWCLEQLYKIPRLINQAQMGFEDGLDGIALHLEEQSFSVAVVDIFIVVIIILLLVVVCLQIYVFVQFVYPDLEDYEKDGLVCLGITLVGVFLIVCLLILLID